MDFIRQSDLVGMILTGGASSRMGREKWSLPWGETTMLGATISHIAPVVSRILIVAHRQQVAAIKLQLSHIPTKISAGCTITIAVDSDEHQGPLMGLATGLIALEQQNVKWKALFLSGCDTPLLETSVIEFLYAQLTPEALAVVPFDGEFPYPLCGIYQREIDKTVQQMVAQGERKMRALLDSIPCMNFPAEKLRPIDPQLHSFLNFNDPEIYEAYRPRDRNESINS
jgi:molybdopterin-guanine dinucleotide biosynthesis protein A